MKKIIPFVFVSCILCVLVIIFKTNKREPIVEPIALDNVAHMKLDLKTLEKVHQNNVFLPLPVREKIVKKATQTQPEVARKEEASIQMEQELLWKEDDTTQKDEEDKSSFSRWIKQKLYGVKMKLKLPF